MAQEVPATLDLQTTIAYALDHNFAIRQARERILEQEGLIFEVKAQVLPSVSLDGNYNREGSSFSAFGGSGSNWQIGLRARQLLYSGGGVNAALDVQRFARESALLELQAVINDQLLATRTRFYDVLLVREQISVQEKNVELLEEQLAMTRNRYEAGAISNFEVLRAEVELANAQPALIRARNNLRTAIDQLRLNIGFDNRAGANLNDVPEFVGTLDFAPVEFDLRDSLDAAQANRPELNRLQSLAEASDAGVKIARSGFKPKLEATAGYQVGEAGFSGAFGNSIDGWQVGVRSSWAIFDGKATKGRVVQAMSQRDQIKLQLQEAVLSVEVEVRRSLSSLDEAMELAEAANKVVAQAEEALRLANSRYGAGTATQLDLLSSQVALTQARDNQLQANYSYKRALATVRRAIGLSDVLLSQ